MQRNLPVHYRGKTRNELALRRPEIEEKNEKAEPTVFHLKAALPSIGRDRLFVAATDRMTVNLMVHAADDSGEIDLHAHPNEDHVFVVLQGAARFADKTGQEFDLRQHEGILLPRKALYRFTVNSDQPLVLLRIGCWIDPVKQESMRMDDHSRPFQGSDQKNTVATRYIPNAFFE